MSLLLKMARTQTLTTTAIILYPFFNIFFLSILPSTSSNFTLKLTHIDSPLSPLHEPNLTDLDRLTKHVEVSTSRASYFQLTDTQNKPICLPVKYRDPIFTVEVGIGTPPVTKTLLFDSGSHLTWTQCMPCRKCFMQHEPFFDPTKSSSYKLMPKKHPLAKSFCSLFGKSCSYNIRYIFGGFTAGDVAMESFGFRSDGGGYVKVPNLVFGCGRNSVGHFPMQISGILGFNREPSSFSRQLGGFINGIFSYCLPPYAAAGASYVRFGDDAAARGRNSLRTPLLNTNPRMYGLNLIDLSINGQKLGLGKSAFGKSCYVDTGAYFSSLNRRAFSAATTFLDKYFSKLDVRRYEGESAPKAMRCYRMPAGFGSFPNMTFHFQGADYGVPPQSLFRAMKGKEGSLFCFLMVESKDATILGAYQQRNVRMVYDLNGEMLLFKQEDCSRDGA